MSSTDAKQNSGMPQLPGDSAMRGLWEISPSPENDELYRKLTPDRRDIVELVSSICERGILQPLIIALDNYIVSGHRRYYAAGLAGLEEVPCQVVPIRRDDDRDEYVRLLRDHNLQRRKTLDEQLREELVGLNPDDTYEALVSERREKTRIKVAALEITGRKRRSVISDAKWPFLRAIDRVLDERREFWPLTVRAIHYALLNDPPLKHASKPDSVYVNDDSSYQALVELAGRARVVGRIPWEAIADETRPETEWQVHQDGGSFIRDELKEIFGGYCRDLMQSQPHHVEIVVEKNTVYNIVRPVAAEFCISVVSGRGFCSLDRRKRMADRFAKSGKRKLIVLLVTDFDPEGEEIAESFARSMRDDFDIDEIHAIKVALTYKQVKANKLPNANPVKESSSNAKRFIAKYGKETFELEALRPEHLQQIVRDSVLGVIDVDAFNREVDAEKYDSAQIQATRKTVREHLASLKL